MSGPGDLADGGEVAAPDPRAFADLLAGYCLDVEHGQRIVVRSTTEATSLLLQLQRAILARGAWPTIHVELPGQARGFYEHAQELQLDDFDELSMAEAKALHAVLGIQAPYTRYEFAGVDPARIARAARARKPVRERTMKKRWCSTLWPTAAGAEQAGMPLDDFGAFVNRALFLDQPDPVRSWLGLSAFQENA